MTIEREYQDGHVSCCSCLSSLLRLPTNNQLERKKRTKKNSSSDICSFGDIAAGKGYLKLKTSIGSVSSTMLASVACGALLPKWSSSMIARLWSPRCFMDRQFSLEKDDLILGNGDGFQIPRFSCFMTWNVATCFPPKQTSPRAIMQNKELQKKIERALWCKYTCGLGQGKLQRKKIRSIGTWKAVFRIANAQLILG